MSTLNKIKYILTDIEGTTTSISFVYDVLFPYFRNNIQKLGTFVHSHAEVAKAFDEVKVLAEAEGKKLHSNEEIIQHLLEWSLSDKKITPLKTVQGIIWNEAYKSGEIKGHVFEDVPQALANWQKLRLKMGVFSSGSIAAQKLIFGYSEYGDLCPYFSHYFDTTTGTKREEATYTKIATEINLNPENILFLSDVYEELEAAQKAGFACEQLVRQPVEKKWDKQVESFLEIVGF